MGNKLKNASIAFFETNYHQLLEGALDNIKVRSTARQIVYDFAQQYCGANNIDTTEVLRVQQYFDTWSTQIIERGYGSVW